MLREAARAAGGVPATEPQASTSFEQVHLEGEPARIDQQPDGDLRVDPTFLTHPDLPQPVLHVG